MTASEWINNNDDILLLIGTMAIFVIFVLLFIWSRHEKSKEGYKSRKKDNFNCRSYMPPLDMRIALTQPEWEEHERQERIQEMLDSNCPYVFKLANSKLKGE